MGLQTLVQEIMALPLCASDEGRILGLDHVVEQTAYTLIQELRGLREDQRSIMILGACSL